MVELIESDGCIEIRTPMRTGARVALALLALFPLLAPYELLLRIDWQSHLHPFFALAAVVSAGAVALSGFLLFAALAGLGSRMVFDARQSRFTYSATSPLIRLVPAAYPLSALDAVGIGTREWSDGAPTHHLRVVVAGGRVYETASSWSRAEVEQLFRLVEDFLARAREQPSPTRQAPPADGPADASKAARPVGSPLR